MLISVLQHRNNTLVGTLCGTQILLKWTDKPSIHWSHDIFLQEIINPYKSILFLRGESIIDDNKENAVRCNIGLIPILFKQREDGKVLMCIERQARYKPILELRDGIKDEFYESKAREQSKMGLSCIYPGINASPESIW